MQRCSKLVGLKMTYYSSDFYCIDALEWAGVWEIMNLEFWQEFSNEL